MHRGWFLRERRSDGSLRAHLRWQLAISVADPHRRRIAEAVVEALNPAGYVQARTGDIAVATQSSIGDVEAAIAVVQTLDPVGVGARDLRECLLLQIRELGLRDSPAERLVEAHFDGLIGGGEGCTIDLGLGSKDFAACMGLIRSLDPMPGSRFCASASSLIN